MRIMSLNEMLTELRFEARLSGDVSHGSHLQARHIALLRRVQEEVYDLYDWPMLKTSGVQDLASGQRYGTYPTNLALGGINKAWVRMASDEDWHELTYGISAEDLNKYDSDADERADTITRWAHHLSDGAEVVNTNMYEVWPVADQTATIRFEGTRALRPLANIQTDYSTLDGMVVVLHAAGEILAGQKAEDAQLKLQTAAARVERMKKAQTAPDNRPVSLYPSSTPDRRTTRFRHNP